MILEIDFVRFLAKQSQQIMIFAELSENSCIFATAKIQTVSG
jgi:hypothetical protein